MLVEGCSLSRYCFLAECMLASGDEGDALSGLDRDRVWVCEGLDAVMLPEDCSSSLAFCGADRAGLWWACADAWS